MSSVPVQSVVAFFVALLGACESTSGNPVSTAAQPAAGEVEESEAGAASEPGQHLGVSRPVDSALLDVDSREMYVGSLVRNEVLSVMHPSEYCLEDGQIWTGAAYRLGRINLFGLEQELAKVDSALPVAVYGEKNADLSSKLQEKGPCPDNYEPIQIQMRSDWVAPEGGPNTRRALLAGLPYIAVRSVRTLKIAEILESDADTVRVRFRNPFSRSMDSLRFRLHYEGGAGKPMPTMVNKVLALEPGASVEIDLPRNLAPQKAGMRRKGGSGLHSLELSGTLGKAEINIKISMYP